MESHSAETALARLREGNRRFVEGHARPRYSAAARAALTEGQRPFAVIVGCSDSRVPVETVFDAGMGELFVIRSAGHVISEAGYVSARYAVEELGAPLVVVLGHEACGAVSAAFSGDVPGWLSPVTDHISVQAPTLAQAIDDHVRESVREISTWFAENAPQLDVTVTGAAYQLSSGEVHWL